MHINYSGYLVNHNLQISSQKHKSPPRLTFMLTMSFALSLTTCYNFLSTQQRFDSRGVLDIQDCPTYIFHISPSQITAARVHSTLQPCSNNQCEQHRMSGIKTHLLFKTCSSHLMRLNTCFQTRLNALYTNNYVVIQNNDSTI